MDIQIKRHKAIFVFMLKGEFDLYNAPELEKVFQKLCAKSMRAFVFDFTDVAYIDSSGIGTLLKLSGIARSKDMPFMLCGVNGDVLSVLTLTNLADYFPMTDSYKGAILSLLRHPALLTLEEHET